jgi:hypothetical protein
LMGPALRARRAAIQNQEIFLLALNMMILCCLWRVFLQSM